MRPLIPPLIVIAASGVHGLRLVLRRSREVDLLDTHAARGEVGTETAVHSGTEHPSLAQAFENLGGSHNHALDGLKALLGSQEQASSDEELRRVVQDHAARTTNHRSRTSSAFGVDELSESRAFLNRLISETKSSIDEKYLGCVGLRKNNKEVKELKQEQDAAVAEVSRVSQQHGEVLTAQQDIEGRISELTDRLQNAKAKYLVRKKELEAEEASKTRDAAALGNVFKEEALRAKVAAVLPEKLVRALFDVLDGDDKQDPSEASEPSSMKKCACEEELDLPEQAASSNTTDAEAMRAAAVVRKRYVCQQLQERAAQLHGLAAESTDAVTQEQREEQQRHEVELQQLLDALQAETGKKEAKGAELSVLTGELKSANEEKQAAVQAFQQADFEQSRAVGACKRDLSDLENVKLCSLKVIRNALHARSAEKAEEVVDCEVSDWTEGSCEKEVPRVGPLAGAVSGSTVSTAPNSALGSAAVVPGEQSQSGGSAAIFLQQLRRGGRNATEDSSSAPAAAESLSPDENAKPQTETISCDDSGVGGLATWSRDVTQEPSRLGAQCPRLEYKRPCAVGKKCPQHCVLADWEPWGECSVMCGVGTQSRQRAVLQPAKYGGDVCLSVAETKACTGAEGAACDKDCVLDTKWSAWSGCVLPCNLPRVGVANFAVRTRGVQKHARGRGTCPVARDPQRFETISCYLAKDATSLADPLVQVPPQCPLEVREDSEVLTCAGGGLGAASDFIFAFDLSENFQGGEASLDILRNFTADFVATRVFGGGEAAAEEISGSSSASAAAGAGGSSSSRFGVIAYGNGDLENSPTEAQLVKPLAGGSEAAFTVETSAAAFSRLQLQHGYANAAQAFLLAKAEFEKAASLTGTTSRKKTLVLVTDGKTPAVFRKRSVEMARKLKAAGVRVFVVAEWASFPVQMNLLKVPSYDELKILEAVEDLSSSSTAEGGEGAETTGGATAAVSDGGDDAALEAEAGEEGAEETTTTEGTGAAAGRGDEKAEGTAAKLDSQLEAMEAQSSGAAKRLPNAFSDQLALQLCPRRQFPALSLRGVLPEAVEAKKADYEELMRNEGLAEKARQLLENMDQ
eukprot:g13609.t1